MSGDHEVPQDGSAVEPGGDDSRPWSQWPARPGRRAVAVHLAVLLGYLAASVLLTWPHARYLVDHQLPATLDTGSYVWGLWWLAHSVQHLSNPWTTSYQAAPAGTQLGLHSLMPLAGAVMTPVTIAFGPSVSFDLLSIAMPGLLSYAMYRVARLWLPGQIGPIAAGAFFGFSAILSFQSWAHISLAAGALFLPLALEAAVRLRRRPTPLLAVILGVVVGASMLTDQETAILTAITAAAALLPWLLSPHRAGAAQPGGAALPGAAAESGAAAPPGGRGASRTRLLLRPWVARLLLTGLAALVAVVVASPQLLAIRHEQVTSGTPKRPSTAAYLTGTRLPYMFEPSPRVTAFGLNIPHGSAAYTFGTMLTVLAVVGLILAWRRLHAWLLALLWLGAAALALGSNLRIAGHIYTPAAQIVRGEALSSVLPYTYLVRLPEFSQFREPSRLAELGLVPAALLAGYAVSWFRSHARPVMVGALVLSVLEAGQVTPAGTRTMRTALPAVDRPIAADHSQSIVLDVPFGLRGGIGITGRAFPPETEVLATADGHPLANAYLARIPRTTVAAIASRPFYRDLMSVQRGHSGLSAAQLAVAAASARQMNIGWILLWERDSRVRRYLLSTGFRYAYGSGRVAVYRPTAATAVAALRPGTRR